MQIREHEKALEVIHQLSDGIRDASLRLKKLLGTIKARAHDAGGGAARSAWPSRPCGL